MNKKCTKCSLTKDISDFSAKSRNKDGLQSACKECQKSYGTGWYKDNREEHIAAMGKRRDIIVLENRKKLFEYYQNNACVDCGEKRPSVLELDHVRGTKHKAISQLVSGGMRWENIEKEIAKCEVRCANCHRHRTSLDQGWYKDLL